MQAIRVEEGIVSDPQEIWFAYCLGRLESTSEALMKFVILLVVLQKIRRLFVERMCRGKSCIPNVKVCLVVDKQQTAPLYTQAGG